MIDDRLSTPDVPPAPVADDEPIDAAGTVGILVGLAIFVTLLLGVLIPLVPWILSGLLGSIAIVCGLMSRSHVRMKVLAVGIAGLVPTALFIVVQLLPRIQLH